ncbi:MAG TPA: hypothetical protein VK174_09285 [Chitinophagales bacterium]|nr:hypothetical protein [Chitinophagales bacterium]
MNNTAPDFSPGYSPAERARVSVLRVLLYFDVFSYALTLDEIFNYTNHALLSETAQALEVLIEQRMISESEGKYSLANRVGYNKHRAELNQRATEFYGKANRYSKLISQFPFVRGVLITGSLSKGCMEKNGDIDYLVITQPGRLWICRSLLTFFKKTVLFNSRKYFCVNYYLDEDSLQVPDKNIFTATEVTSAKPAYNSQTCERFFKENNWTTEFYPNYKQHNPLTVHNSNNGAVKRTMEKLLGGKMGDAIDERLMRLFLWHWKRKFKGQDNVRFEVNFRSRKNVSKHHPQGFQFKVLNAYNQNLKNFEEQYNIRLA